MLSFQNVVDDAAVLFLGGATLVAIKFAAAALVITGRPNHYTADIGRGSMAVVTYNHGSLQLEPPSALTFQLRLMEGIAGLMIKDHRRAVESYARFLHASLGGGNQANE